MGLLKQNPALSTFLFYFIFLEYSKKNFSLKIQRQHFWSSLTELAVHAFTPPPLWTHNATQLMLSTPLIEDTRERVNVHCTLWLHVILNQADYHDEDELRSESPSCSFLLTSWTAVPWPFVSCCWPCKTQTHPGQRSHFSLRHQRHSVVGVLTIQRAQSDWLPALPSTMTANASRADGRLLSLRKAMSEERPQSIGGESLPQEFPLLCRVTEAMMEQGEKERVREIEDAVLLTHICRKKEGSLIS